MQSMATTPSSLLFFLLLSFTTTIISHAKVPSSQTFIFVNQGELGPYITEYDASYRALDLYASPFQLCFYNTTPNAFYLALRMGTLRSESTFRWVWEANRGLPVRENATLTFSSDGNLVLADADRRVVWSTATANKGVVGLKLLPTGNIVLYDGKGKFLWQSFDHPTDTLLVGQSLRPGGPTKLISRKSSVDGSFGIYSLVMESGGLAMYINNISTKPLPYGMLSVSGKLNFVKFECETLDLTSAYELRLATTSTIGNGSNSGTITLARPKYNATLSFLRLQVDGNLVGYTFYDPVDYRAWERTFTFFSDDGMVSGCSLPSKCGSLGVCEDEMCVACPSPKGLSSWSKGCIPPKLRSCKAGDYYKVVGVENFLSSYVEGEGPMKVEECRKKCSLDCKCVGFLYWEESSKCWLAPVVGTLAKVSNSSHQAFIKY